MSNTFLNNKETALAVVELGIKKANNPVIITFLLGIMGGVFVSLGYLGALMAMGDSASTLNPALVRLMGGIVFPVGIMLVAFVGGDLSTGNALIGLSYFNKKITLQAMSINWVVVWFGNFVGAIAAAYMIYMAQIAGPDVISFTLLAAKQKLSLSNVVNIFSGFFCNVIVALAIWMSLASKDITGKIFSLYFPIVLFVMTGYQHCVANMFLFSYAQILGADFSNLVILNAIFMATIGNLLSGGIVIPFIYNYIYLKN